MRRTPVITRKPITLNDLRQPITIDNPYDFYPVWGFEGIYEINLVGVIKKLSNGSQVSTHDCTSGKVVCLRHPDGDGSVLCANLSDVWTSTFLGDKALSNYSYMDSIKKK